MSDKIIKLIELSNQISSELTDMIVNDKINGYITSIIVGGDPSSLSYLSGIEKRSKKLGLAQVSLNVFQYPKDSKETWACS